MEQDKSRETCVTGPRAIRYQTVESVQQAHSPSKHRRGPQFIGRRALIIHTCSQYPTLEALAQPATV